MPDRWMIRGREFVNCNCAWGCPCQFNAPATHGFCEAISTGIIDEGHFNDTRLDGFKFMLIAHWPGQIAEGNGLEQIIIDERADADQREALRKILHGESTRPGATHFYVFNSTMSEVLDTIYAPIEAEIDIEARRARAASPGLVQTRGASIINPHSGQEHRVSIHLPEGFEYTRAEIGRGSTKSTAGITMELNDSNGQFNVMHMNQDGVIR
jgi:hypothetical protein